MSDLEKYNKINSASTVEELEQAILDIADNGYIMGRSEPWPATAQANSVKFVVNNVVHANALTRSYGIRQQALMIKYYEKD